MSQPFAGHSDRRGASCCFLVYSSVFVVNARQQAIVLRFGRSAT